MKEIAENHALEWQLPLLYYFLFTQNESESEVAQWCLTLSDPVDCSLPCSSIHGIFPFKSTGVGCHFLLQGTFLTHGSNPDCLHCMETLYPLSHQGSPKYSPRILSYIHSSSAFFCFHLAEKNHSLFTS